jgi:tripartite-type tricarboxylate transporter receptor subunit TctC
MKTWRTGLAGAAIAAAFALPGAAIAQADFYAGRTLTLVVGAPPTGSYAAYARLLANHLGRHIPGNPVIELNFRGGGDGGLGTSQYMEQAAPADGLHLGITQQTIPVSQVIQPDVGDFDVRTWQWVGGMAPLRNMLGIWHTAPGQTIEDAQRMELRVGATSVSSPMYIVPRMMNEFLGTRFNIITGYDGVGGTNLAMEQGEIHGRGASWASVINGAPHYIEQNLFRAMVVDGATRDPAIPYAPTLMELAPNEEVRQVFELLAASATFGRSFFFSQNVPADRVEIIRRAFEATLQDEAFLAEARQQRLAIELVSHQDLQAQVDALFQIPPEVVARAAAVMSGG